MLPVPLFEQKKVVSFFAILAYIGLALLGLWLLYALRALIPPLLVAAIIAMTLVPVVDQMDVRGRLLGVKISRGVAIGVIYLLFLAFFGLILYGLIPIISDQMTHLISTHLPKDMLHSRKSVSDHAIQWMNRHHVPGVLRPPVLNQAQHVPELLTKGLQYFSANLPGMAENVVWIVIVPIVAFFLLLDFYKILGKLLILMRRDRREDILDILKDVIAVFGNYVRGVLTVMVLDIGVIYLVLRIAGLKDYALTLAATAGILYTIPYFGAIVSTLLIGLVTWATHGTVDALIVTGVMIIIHQVIFDNIIAPRIIGGSVHLHPLLTLLALMAGGTLFGIGGTLLAVPIAAAAQIVIVHLFPQFKTDVVAVRRAAAVVETSVDAKDEEERPEARKDGDEAELEQREAAARQAAQRPPPLLPPAAS